MPSCLFSLTGKVLEHRPILTRLKGRGHGLNRVGKVENIHFAGMVFTIKQLGLEGGQMPC